MSTCPSVSIRAIIEFCSIVPLLSSPSLHTSNHWKVPDKPGCTLFIHPHQGWPIEDYDMIGNEAAIPAGKVESFYTAQGKVAGNEARDKFGGNDHKFRNVSNVKWITILRHPYSRTLSHYHHLHRNKKYHNLTLHAFLTQFHGGGFKTFIPNQMTRWHCGTGPCVSRSNRLSPHELQHAMDNLKKMSAVLILEDFGNPSSCSRRQMRYVFKFDKLEAFSDIENNHTQVPPKPRQSNTKWDEAIRPYLDDAGSSTNQWALSPHDQVGNMSNSGTHFNSTSPNIMAALGLHNDYDMQLYGYAKHLCSVLADKYVPLATTTNISTTSTNKVSICSPVLPSYYTQMMQLIIMQVVVILALTAFLKPRGRQSNNGRGL